MVNFMQNARKKGFATISNVKRIYVVNLISVDCVDIDRGALQKVKELIRKPRCKLCDITKKIAEYSGIHDYDTRLFY